MVHVSTITGIRRINQVDIIPRLIISTINDNDDDDDHGHLYGGDVHPA